VGRHGELPRPLAPPGARPVVTLVAAREGRELLTRVLGSSEVAVHVGRDPRCELRLDDPQVSRLHLTLVRLVGRWAFRNESQHGTLRGGALAPAGVLADGDLLTVGGVEVTVRSERPARPVFEAGGPLEVGPAWVDALATLGHPSVADALAAEARDLEAALAGPVLDLLARRLCAPANEGVEALADDLRARARARLEALAAARARCGPASGPQVAPAWA
jgi:hypothetical protein